MTLTGKLTAAQVRPGGPIDIGYRWQATAEGDDNVPNAGYGVTTTPTRPTIASDLTHRDVATSGSASLWSATNTFFLSKQQGASVNRVWSDTWDYRTRRALDSNYVAGRYLWAFGIGDEVVVDGSTLVALSGPYHIR